MARRPFIAGNWKMNHGPHAAASLARELRAGLVDQAAVDVAVLPPAISIAAVVERLRHTVVEVGAQDLHPAPHGAFTGAIAGEMLREAGCTRVVVGHSERRQLFGEDDALVRQKVEAALRAGLLPILCCGETLAERESGAAQRVVERQLDAALRGLPPDQAVSITIAYEPVWAIGTGRTASPDQAQELHAHIRGWLRAHFPRFVADDLRIQYGGSVKASNAASLFAMPDIDGALVGGASLTAAEFLGIVSAASSTPR
jgi:triosephosphate isomerase